MVFWSDPDPEKARIRFFPRRVGFKFYTFKKSEIPLKSFFYCNMLRLKFNRVIISQITVQLINKHYIERIYIYVISGSFSGVGSESTRICDPADTPFCFSVDKKFFSLNHNKNMDNIY